MRPVALGSVNDTIQNPPEPVPLGPDLEPAPQPQPVVTPKKETDAERAKRSHDIAVDAELTAQHEAMIRRAAERMGVTPRLMRGVPPELLEQKPKDWEHIANNSPIVARFVGEDPSNAAIIGDEYDKLEQVERAVDNVRLQRIRSLVGLNQAVDRVRASERTTEELREKLQGSRAGVGHAISESYDYGNEYIVMRGEALFQKHILGKSGYDDYISYLDHKWQGRGEPSGFINYLAGSASEMTPLILSATGEGLKYAIPTATAVGIAGQFGPQAAIPEEIITVPTAAFFAGKYGAMSRIFRTETGLAAGEIDSILSVDGENIDPIIRNSLAVAIGGANTYLEKIGFSKLSGLFKPGVEALKSKFMTSAIKRAAKDKDLGSALAGVFGRYVKAVGTEAGTEAAQELSQMFGTWLAVHAQEIISDKQFSEDDRTLFNDGSFDRMVQAFSKAGSAALVFGFGPTVVDTAIVSSEVNAAKDHVQILKNVNHAINETELLQNSPETVRMLFQAMDHQGNEFIDGEAAAELWDQGGSDVFEKLGFTRNELQSAADLGQDIEVEIGQITMLPPALFDKLSPILKANSQAISLRTAEGMDAAETIKAVAERFEEGTEDLKAYKTKLRELGKQVVAAGRTEQEADQWMRVVEKFGLRMAAQSKDLSSTLGQIAERFVNSITIQRATKEENEQAIGELTAIDMERAFNMRDTNADGILRIENRGFAKEVTGGDILLAKDASAPIDFGGAKGLSAYNYALVPHGTDQAVINKLNDAGVKIVEYNKGDRAHQATQLRLAAQQDGLVKTVHKVQGGLITNGEHLVKLFDGSNESTLLHETGHIFLNEMTSMVRNDQADESLVKDLFTIFKWLGVKAGDDITTDQHEQFARSFEAWLMEGKAPSAELVSTFERFRDWLKSIYTDVRGLESQAGFKVNLNDDVRRVFDRMLAADDEIADLASTLEFNNLGASEVEALSSLNDSDRAELRSLREAGIKKAAERVAARRRKGLLRKAKEWTRQERQAVNELAVNKATAQIRDDGGLDLAYMKQHFEPDVIKNLRAKGLLAKKDAENGVHPDEYAILNGYPNGREMIKEIAGTPSLREQVKSRVSRRMDLAEDLVLGEEAILQSDEFARQMEITEKAIQETSIKKELRSGEPTRTRKQWQDTAARILSAMNTVDAMNTGKFMGELKQANRKMREALLSNRKDKYIRARSYAQQARKSFELAKQSMQIRKDIDRMIKLAKQTRKAKPGVIEEQHHQNALALIERFQLARGKSKLRTDPGFERMPLKQLLEGEIDGTHNISAQFSDALVTELVSNDFRYMPIAQVAEVETLLSTIVKQGRDERKRTIANTKLNIEQAAEAISKEVNDNAPHVEKKVRAEMIDQARSASRESSGWLRSFFAQHRKVASLVREMSGFEDGGVMWDLIVRPMNEAQTNEAVEMEQATLRMERIFDNYSRSERVDFEKTSDVGGVMLTKRAQLMVALNTGNEDNYQKLISADDKATGLNENQVLAILDSLTEKDIKFINEIWEFIDSYWPQVSGVNRRITGVTPKKVEGVSRSVKNGELKGGYFPLMYEWKASQKANKAMQEGEAKATLAGKRIAAQTRHGHRKERSEVNDLPIRLDWGVISEHIQSVIHDFTHYEFIKDASRLIRQPDVNAAIIDNYGNEVYAQFTSMLETLAQGEVTDSNAFNRIFNHIRTGSSIASMGWSMTTASQQILGYTLSFNEVGPRYMLRGLFKFFGSAIRLQGISKDVWAKSEYMRLRSKTMQREINEIRNKVSKPGGKFYNFIASVYEKATLGKSELEDIGNSFFYLIAKFQQAVDIPTWLGAYEKSLDQGIEESKAVALADQAVRNSQGGGQTGDLAAIERGSAALKLFTNFYSIFNVTYNQNVEATKSTLRDVRQHGMSVESSKSVGLLLVNYMMTTVIPASLGLLMMEQLRGDEPEEDLASRLLAENLSYLAGQMIGLRELGSAIKGFSGYNGPAGSRFFNEMSKTIKQMQQGEPDAALFKALNNSGGILFHYPAVQVQRSVEGFLSALDGESPPSAVLFGPSR